LPQCIFSASFAATAVRRAASASEAAGPAVVKGTRSGKPAREAPPTDGKEGRRREPRPVLDLPDLDPLLSAPGLPKDLGDAEMMTIVR